LRLCGESSASPTIKKTTIFVQIIIIVGVADSWGSGSKFIVASINHRKVKGRESKNSPQCDWKEIGCL
jgi:hypothetical protein